MVKSKIYFSANTDVGLRDNNEDNIYAGELGEELFVFIVADGMGGMGAGEIASEISIRAAVQSIRDNYDAIVSKTKGLKEIITLAFLASQTQVADDVLENPDRSGMGTTQAIVVLYKDRFAIGNMGDSRVYLRRRGKLKLLTKDHSYVFDEQLNLGKDLHETVIKKYGHIVTKVVDGKNTKPDVFPVKSKTFKIRKNDGILLCSDGLITSDVYNAPKKIQNAIKESTSSQAVSQVLIDWAIKNGSTDNVSVIYLSRNPKI